MNDSTSRTLRAIVGPTASGKGSLARAVADRVDCDLLVVDSMKVYRGLDIGAAKPTAAVRPHYRYRLLDLVDPRERFSVADWLRAAETAEAEALASGARALFVGGTALYLRALRHGLFEGAGRDDGVRARLEREVDRIGAPGLHARLESVDPTAAARIHPNDAKRIVRALEVFEVSGTPISAVQREARVDRRPVRWVGLRWSREALRRRIDRRVDRMLDAGLVEEVRALDGAGAFGPTAGEAIGYPEIRAHLAGRASLTDAVDSIKRHTAQLARRQMTWFRSWPDIAWIDLDDGADPTEHVERALELLGWGTTPGAR